MTSSFQLLPYGKKISEISIAAINEAALEKMMFKIIELWNTSPLHLVLHHTEGYSILIISSIDDTIAQLEDSQAILATIKASSYMTPIEVDAVEMIWECFHFLQPTRFTVLSANSYLISII